MRPRNPVDTPFRRAPAAVLVAGATVASLWLSLQAPTSAQRQAGPVPHSCNPLSAPCMRVVNAFVRADVSPFGSFTMGTTDGDPDTTLDNDKLLLYGFVGGGGSDVGSSYTTLHIDGPSGAENFVPRSAQDVVEQVQLGDRSVRTVWRTSGAYRLRVTETLELALNPFSDREDVINTRWEITNEGVAVEAGLRALLDVKIGNNDGAPYFVPGLGTVTHEAAFTGTEVPAYWLAFEDPAYDPSRLRGLGLLESEHVSKPDAFWIAYWPRIQREPWRYAIDASRAVTSDSAVALLWQPQPLSPGATRVIDTRYGIAANRGGRAFLTAPVSAGCQTTIVASLFVSNFDVLPLAGGSATIELPPGLQVENGEQSTKAMPDIAPGDTGSVAWRVRIGPGVVGSLPLEVSATFDGDIRHETSETIDVRCEAAPTATPPPTPTPRPSPTPGPSPTTVTAPGACEIVYGRVPTAAINAALANPERVFGWGMLANPNLPPSPVNPPRKRLSLRTISKPYSAEGNPLIYKVGCP